MYRFEMRPEVGPIEEARERIYGFLAALFSHPDEGNWGRVLNALEQRSAIEAADRVRAVACERDHGMLPEGPACDELDLRYLVVELCQPLEHLQGEYERVLCTRRPPPRCSPYELHHHDGGGGQSLAESLADLALIYRSFGFFDGDKLPLRPDHIAFEMGFMSWLLSQRRLAIRMDPVDRKAAEHATLCDLAQRNFFGDHLASWVASFAAGLQRHTGGGYFEPLGRFLAAWIALERQHLGLEPRFAEANGRREEVSVGT